MYNRLVVNYAISLTPDVIDRLISINMTSMGISKVDPLWKMLSHFNIKLDVNELRQLNHL